LLKILLLVVSEALIFIAKERSFFPDSQPLPGLLAGRKRLACFRVVPHFL
jgi:hypothetical protein